MRYSIPKKTTFEEALDKLESLVGELESGETALKDILEKYTQGVLLSKFCLQQLDDAEAAMDKVVGEKDGAVVEAPLRIEGEREDV